MMPMPRRADRGQQEDQPDPLAAEAHLLEDRQHDHEDEEAAGVETVDLVELLLEGSIG
jgi:hypothetical protein